MSTHMRNPGDPQTPWRVEPGERLLRSHIHDRYGGRIHTMISPCKSRSANILLFSDPQPYPGCYNGWDDEGRFHFHGEGLEGDQELRQGNLALRDHAVDGGRPLRLFVPVPGTQQWEYLGRFRLDDRPTSSPWPGVLMSEGPDRCGQVRSVLVFLLVSHPDQATTILQETPTSWIVACERTGCSRRMINPKRIGRPADHQALDPDSSTTTWIEQPYPMQRWCWEHPPPQAQRALARQQTPRTGPATVEGRPPSLGAAVPRISG
ncbi:hypothetical protein [Planobispora rosea]|uniref:hypothetical protein n=1 Tax=Planobispora rosea TaxID=35762 RepID=UPI0016711CDC|nr:hypothetical protein [Planobispora rosea]